MVQRRSVSLVYADPAILTTARFFALAQPVDRRNNSPSIASQSLGANAR
jgi:hypothetical protein